MIIGLGGSNEYDEQCTDTMRTFAASVPLQETEQEAAQRELALCAVHEVLQTWIREE